MAMVVCHACTRVLYVCMQYVSLHYIYVHAVASCVGLWYMQSDGPAISIHVLDRSSDIHVCLEHPCQVLYIQLQNKKNLKKKPPLT
jgi:hypothetical protein